MNTLFFGQYALETDEHSKGGCSQMKGKCFLLFKGGEGRRGLGGRLSLTQMVDRKTDLFDCLQKASSIDLAFLESGKEFEFFLISNEKQQVNDFIEIRKAFERKIIALFEKGLIKRLPFRHLTKLSPGQREGFSGEEVIGGNLVTQDFGFPKILILRLTRQIAFEVKRGTRSDPLR